MGFPRAQGGRGNGVRVLKRQGAVGVWDGAVCGSRCPTIRSGSECLRVWLWCVVYDALCVVPVSASSPAGV